LNKTEGQVDLAVSTVIFALRPQAGGSRQLAIPLVRRIREPYLDAWALPGGPLERDEDLSEAAARNLQSTTNLEPRFLEQLYAFGDPDRSGGDSSAARVVSIVYWALVGSEEAAAAVESENVHWFFVDEIPQLAFDHNLIVEYALWRLRNKVSYSRVAHGFLNEVFTLAELRSVYEVILGKTLDPGNFRRSVEASGTVVATGERLSGTSHRPPQLYRYNDAFELSENGPLTRGEKK
jgi:8-oxo-dGTP diphosphatase